MPTLQSASGGSSLRTSAPASALARSVVCSSDARDRLQAALAPGLVDAIEELIAERVEAALAEWDAIGNERVWLTLAEAGERLGCSADAVRMRAKRGRLTSRRHGSRLYVSATSVDGLGKDAVR